MKTFNLPYKNLKLIILDRSSTDEDRPIIRKFVITIFNILSEAYQPIGGCTVYKSPKRMLNAVGRYKIVVDDSDQIYAVAVYNTSKNNYKCTLIGRNMHHNDIDAKEAVKWIIKSDIVNWKNLYWIEAYDAVAHWYEKYGAFKIPAVYVPTIWEEYKEEIHLTDDLYVYKRHIMDMGLKPKIMFGFLSKDAIHKLLNEEQILAYTEHLNKLYNGVTGKLLESNLPVHRIKNIRASLYFIEKSYKEKGQFRNIIPATYKTIVAIYNEAVQMLKNNTLPEPTKREVMYLCNFCKTVVRNANIIQIHKLFDN